MAVSPTPAVRLCGWERIAGRCTKFAMMTLFVVIATLSGLALPVASPVQLRNCQSFEGVAVSAITGSPLKMLPGRLTKPNPLFEMVSVYVDTGGKTACA